MGVMYEKIVHEGAAYEEFGSSAGTTYYHLIKYGCDKEYARSIAQWQLDVIGREGNGQFVRRFRRAYPVYMGGDGLMYRDQIEVTPYKLNKGQFKYMTTGLKEVTWDMFHPKFSLGRPYNEMPTVLTWERFAKTAVEKGLLAESDKNPTIMPGKVWYRLGEVGMEIVNYWIKLGYSYHSLGLGIMPPKEVLNDR
jgi:hypothetical protein